MEKLINEFLCQFCVKFGYFKLIETATPRSSYCFIIIIIIIIGVNQTHFHSRTLRMEMNIV